jgi:hypothetical protein
LVISGLVIPGALPWAFVCRPVGALGLVNCPHLWHLLKYNQPYDPNVWAAAEEKLKKKKIQRLHQQATALGYQLLTTA